VYLLLLGLLFEVLTLVVQRWISFPISWALDTKISLTVLCVAAFLLGVIWFNRSINLIEVHLLNGKNALTTHGPFAYVRHPLYATFLTTLPPLVMIWFSDLLFFMPWVLIFVVSHFVVRLEERGAGGERYRTQGS
jgi:protein-S-isoprenylcysteine O-methyltransferase Ste14